MENNGAKDSMIPDTDNPEKNESDEMDPKSNKQNTSRFQMDVDNDEENKPALKMDAKKKKILMICLCIFVILMILIGLILGLTSFEEYPKGKHSLII